MAIGIGLVQFYIGKTKLGKNCRIVKELNAHPTAHPSFFCAKLGHRGRLYFGPMPNLPTGEPYHTKGLNFPLINRWQAGSRHAYLPQTT
jgi:hypothetical protein